MLPHNVERSSVLLECGYSPLLWRVQHKHNRSGASEKDHQKSKAAYMSKGAASGKKTVKKPAKREQAEEKKKPTEANDVDYEDDSEVNQQLELRASLSLKSTDAFKARLLAVYSGYTKSSLF